MRAQWKQIFVFFLEWYSKKNNNKTNKQKQSLKSITEIGHTLGNKEHNGIPGC